MALRVLLADESSTIKKVVQLTLQDFDVEVRSVGVGLDVLSVAKTFYPDIIMADVLLAKRSGYEICHDIKNDAETAHIPVVLMWSGFMEIDEQKARLSGADERIEKPFDPSTLRNIVKNLVQKTKSNPVSSYIQFPPLPEFQEKAKPTPAPTPLPHAPPPQGPRGSVESTSLSETSAFNFQSLEPTQTGIGKSANHDEALVMGDIESEPGDEWIQKPPPVPRGASPTSNPKPTVRPMPTSEPFSEFQLITQPKKIADSVIGQMPQNISAAASEDILRDEIQKWLSANMLPIAERIIRDEINRLLQDSDQSIEGS